MWNTYYKKVTILDRDEFIKELNRVIAEYSQKLPVYIHPKCFEELMQLLQASGSEKAFIRKLLEFLSIIYSNPTTFAFSSGLENIKGESGIYSMRFKLREKNIRILFSIQENSLLALTAFHERSGKKISSYSSYFPIAHMRLKDMIR